MIDIRVRSVLEPSWQPLILRLEIFCRQEPKHLLWYARIVTISMWRPSMELGHHTAVMLCAQQLEDFRWLPCDTKAGWRTYSSVKGLHFHFETLCNSTDIIKVMLHSLLQLYTMKTIMMVHRVITVLTVHLQSHHVSYVLLMEKVIAWGKPFIAAALVTLLVSSFASYTVTVINAVLCYQKKRYQFHVMEASSH